MSHPNTDHQSNTLLSDIDTQPPKRYGVFLLNDDYTTMGSIIEVLTEVFVFAQEQTVAVILLVYHEGKGLCSTYMRDIVQAKQHQVMEHVKAERHLLKCIVEKA